jgi:hypothetical protein
VDAILLGPEHQDVLRMVQSREIRVEGRPFAPAFKCREDLFGWSIYPASPPRRRNGYGLEIHWPGDGLREQKRITVLVVPRVEGITPIDDYAPASELPVKDG